MFKSNIKLKDRIGNKGLRVESEKKKEMYIFWRSIPALLRKMPEADLRTMGYDIDDPLFLKLLRITSNFGFQKEFGISYNTIRKFEEDPDLEQKIDNISLRDNVMRFKKDVEFSFTQKVIRYGDAARTKLWMQRFEGFREGIEGKIQVTHFDATKLVERLENEKETSRDG